MKIIATFPYVQVGHPTVGTIHQPMVNVHLGYRTTRLRHLMFLDSGADISLIPASVGLALGLLPEDSPTTSVRGFVAERAGLHIVELHLQIGDTVEWPFRVGLADNDNVPSLLGRLDVFDHYTFEFNHERRMVVVKQ